MDKCEVVRDLLPLYIDNVCSAASTEFIDQHLGECEPCRMIYDEMKDSSAETELKHESEGVLKNQQKFFRRKGFTAGAIVAAIIFMIPVLICLVVNLAQGSRVTWVFIVAAALLIPVSLTVVPLMAPDNKGLWTLGAFTGSLITLLAVCCVYSGGNWFFVAASAVLFGLAVVFLPFVAKSAAVRALIKKNRALYVVGVDTVLFVLMLVSIDLTYGNGRSLWAVAAGLAPLALYVWALVAEFSLLKTNGLVKAGICVALTGVMIFFYDFIAGLFMGAPGKLPTFAWDKLADGSFDSIMWLVLLSSVLIGVIFAGVGLIIGKKEKTNEKSNH